MTLLVVGADRVDAGKTTFTVGLLHAIDGVGFKPRAANDYWFDHDDVRAALADGRLVGKDARRLAAAGRGAPEPTAINPVHRLWRPVPGSGGLLGRDGRAVLLDRVGDEFVVNATADIPADVAEALPLADATRVRTLEAFDREMEERYLPRLDALADRIRGTQRAVVESYGDVARPLRSLAVDRVAVVEPGRVRIVDGDRFDRACEVASGRRTDGRLEERVPNVVEPMDPIATLDLPALPAGARVDPGRVAAAYEDAYEALR